MIDKTERLLDHFPGIFFLSCTSMADQKSNSITPIILYSNLYRVHNFLLT